MHINWAHVHLLINHVPVIGVFGGILLLAYALVRKSEEVKMVSLGVFVLIALVTIPVFLTGEGAEDVVKHIPGVTETYIGRHEELAELTLVLMEILGVLALTALVLLKLRGTIPTIIVILVLVMSLITATAVGITANLGGQIRHTEIRDVAGPAPESQPAR
jgi:uncharacterized membrane protein